MRVFHRYDALIPRDESCWVKTKARTRNWPKLSGRFAQFLDRYVVIGFNIVPDWEDRFVWIGSEEEFRAVWESNARMEPVRFNFANAA